MNYGHLFRKRKTDSGYGLLRMSVQEKLSVYILENAINYPAACGGVVRTLLKKPGKTIAWGAVSAPQGAGY